MNRRQLLNTALSGTALAALSLGGFGRHSALAADPTNNVLKIVSRTIDVNGKSAKVYGLVNAGGTPGLTFTEGDNFAVALINHLSEPTIVHWHGLRPPYDQDGVANMPLPMLASGEMRHYDFPVGAAGTFWMHAHTLQEQNLLAAPLIVRDKDAATRDEQEVVVLLHDFSFKPAEELLAGLGKSGGVMSKGSMGGMSMSGGMAGMDMSKMDMSQAGGMSMGSMTMDLNDIAYDAYLANDRTFDDPEVVKVDKGGRVRLRLINGAAATAFTIDTGELLGELIAVDGHEVEPVGGNLFPISMGQRLDIRLALPADGKAYPIVARREGAPEVTGIVVAPAGASISRIARMATVPGPILDLTLESRLRAKSPLIGRPAERTLPVMLMGDMQSYKWSMATQGPLTVRKGERVRVTMMNHSMMAHPMHLHGHAFQVVQLNGTTIAGAVRDTLLVPPMSAVAVEFDADHPGKWAFHCHHLYHMVSGMMSTIEYDSAG